MALNRGTKDGVKAMFVDDRPLAEPGLVEIRKNHKQGMSICLGSPKLTDEIIIHVLAMLRFYYDKSHRGEDLIIPESMAQDFSFTGVLGKQVHSRLRNCFSSTAVESKETSFLVRQAKLVISCKVKVLVWRSYCISFIRFNQPPVSSVASSAERC